MDMHSCGAAKLLTLGLLCASPAAAQFPQYTAPGSLAVPQTPTEERVERASEAARWDLGALRLDPRFWVRNMGYNDNVFGAPDGEPQVSDITASIGAGLVGFSNLGSDLLFSVFLLPEYTWWQDQEQLREENVNFGASLFGFYNRLTLMLDARREEGQQFLSSEALVPFDIRTDRARLQLAIDVSEPIELFGSVEARDFEHRGRAAEGDPLALLTLDRDELLARLGVAYRFPSSLRIGLGAAYSETDFVLDPAGRSNTTFGPLLEASYGEGALELAAAIVLRELDFEGSGTGSRSEVTGQARAGWQSAGRLRLDLYGGRSIVYSVLRPDRFFTEDRYGLSAGTPWGRRFHARVYGETGTNDYQRVADETDPRRDDVTSFGAELEIEINRRLQVSVSGTRTKFDSSQPEFDRSVSIFRAGVRVGGDPRPW